MSSSLASQIRPEIEDDELHLAIAFGREDEEVPRVRIGVEEPIDEEHLVEGLDELEGDVLGLHAGGAELIELRDLEAFHERHREDVLGGEIVDHFGERDPALAFEVLRHPLHARGLVQVVRLATEEIDERLVDALDLRDGDEALVDEDGEAEHAQIDGDDAADPRVEDLHRDLATAFEVRDVHLA